MKLVKKALAGLCALTMAMTAAASLAVTASAAELPTLYPVITVDEEAKTADIELHVKNLPTEANNQFKDPLYIFGITAHVDVSSYSTEPTNGMDARTFITWKNNHYKAISPTMEGLNSTQKPGYFTIGGSYTSVTAAKSDGMLITSSDMLIGTIVDIPLTDDALKNGFTVGLAGVNDKFGFNMTVVNELMDYSEEYLASTSGSTGATENATWTPSTPPEPTVDWSTATKYGDYHSDIDNSDAVAYTAELTGDGTVEYDKVTWKVTPADGSAAKGCYADVNIGGTGTYTIGLVIGDVTSDQITSVEAALGAQGNNAQ